MNNHESDLCLMPAKARLTPALARRTLTYRWVCLGLLFLTGLLAFFTRLAPAVTIPDLRDAFALNAAELALLTSLYLWPFALMQPVAGALTDAFGPRRTVTAFLIVAGAGQMLFACAPTFAVALIGRALTGLGASVLYVGAAKIMAQWFRSSEFGTLTGAWTSVANLGGLTAAGPLMALVTLAGWRLSLGGVGLIMLATALLVYMLVRNSPGERPGVRAGRASAGRGHRHGDAQPLLLARRRRLPAGQRHDRGGVSEAERSDASCGLSGRVLVLPGLGCPQHRSRRLDHGTRDLALPDDVATGHPALTRRVSALAATARSRPGEPRPGCARGPVRRRAR